MKEWKQRQEIYHRTNEIVDILDGTEKVVRLDQVRLVRVVMAVSRYFTREQKEIVQPIKSLAVAIIYAKLLEKYFGEDFYHALSDPYLLFGNDQHFAPYPERKEVYDAVILGLQRKGLLDNLESIDLPQVQATIHFFKQEFLLT